MERRMAENGSRQRVLARALEPSGERQQFKLRERTVTLNG